MCGMKLQRKSIFTIFKNSSDNVDVCSSDIWMQ